MIKVYLKLILKEKKAILAALVFIAVATTCPSAVRAMAFQDGDIFAAVGNIVSGGKIEHYDKNLNLIQILDTGITTFGIVNTGMGFDQAGNLYVTNHDENGAQNSVTRFSNTALPLIPPLPPDLPNPFLFGDFASGIESIVFDAAGNIYVGQSGSFALGSTKDIIKFDKNGLNPISFTAATEMSGTDAIDLAGDQKTIFYTSEGRKVKRYDVSADAQLPDFADLSTPGETPGLEAFSLRLLENPNPAFGTLGAFGLLVADKENIKLLDENGSLVRTYDVLNENNWFALNLDPDGTSFWSGNEFTNTFCKFDISGILTPICQGVTTPGVGLLGLTVFNEITAAVPSTPPGPGNGVVPEPSTVLLFGSGLVGLGLWRWKEGKKEQ